MEQNTSQTEPDRFLPISILVAALLISGSLIYVNTNDSPKKLVEQNGGDTTGTAVTASVSDPLPRDVILGNADAPVTLIEYGDYQCPFCARFYVQTEVPIRDNYVASGKAKIIYRDFAFLGQESLDAANAAECAKDQGKFWAYHDALFTAEHSDNIENNGNLNRTLFLKIAGDLGMDLSKFTPCVDSNQYVEEVKKSYTNASAVGVEGTPATYVNGKVVPGGAQPYATYQGLFDGYLAQ